MKPSAILTNSALALLFACSSSTPAASVQLPNSLKIASITVAGTTDDNAWTRENPIPSLTLSCSSAAPLIVDIDPKVSDSAIDAFTLEAPNNCGTLTSCGWLVLRVVASDGTEVDIATASSPITVNGVTQPGTYDFVLELHDASDAVLHRADGAAVGDTVSVELLAPDNCPASGQGDAG